MRTRLRQRFATTLPRFDLMSQLERDPEGVKMRELSHRMMVTGGNITGIVDQLAGEGLVQRVADADRRAWRVRLTKAGERAFAEMARAHEAWIVEALAGLTRREHGELFALLAKVKLHCHEVVEKETKR